MKLKHFWCRLKVFDVVSLADFLSIRELGSRTSQNSSHLKIYSQINLMNKTAHGNSLNFNWFYNLQLQSPFFKMKHWNDEGNKIIQPSGNAQPLEDCEQCRVKPAGATVVTPPDHPPYLRYKIEGITSTVRVASQHFPSTAYTVTDKLYTNLLSLLVRLKRLFNRLF